MESLVRALFGPEIYTVAILFKFEVWILGLVYTFLTIFSLWKSSFWYLYFTYYLYLSAEYTRIAHGKTAKHGCIRRAFKPAEVATKFNWLPLKIEGAQRLWQPPRVLPKNLWKLPVIIILHSYVKHIINIYYMNESQYQKKF